MLDHNNIHTASDLAGALKTLSPTLTDWLKGTNSTM